MSITKMKREGEGEGEKVGEWQATAYPMTSERLMPPNCWTIDERQEHLQIKKYLAREILILRIIPYIARYGYDHFSTITKCIIDQLKFIYTCSTHSIFILSLSRRVSFGRILRLVLLVVTFRNYVAALDVIQGRTPSPLPSSQPQEYTK